MTAMAGDAPLESASATRSENRPTCCGRHAAANDPPEPIVVVVAWVHGAPFWLCSIRSVWPGRDEETVPVSHRRPRSSTSVWLETVIPSPLTVTSWLATAAAAAYGVVRGSPSPPDAASVGEGAATAATMSTAATFSLRGRAISLSLFGAPTG